MLLTEMATSAACTSCNAFSSWKGGGVAVSEYRRTSDCDGCYETPKRRAFRICIVVAELPSEWFDEVASNRWKFYKCSYVSIGEANLRRVKTENLPWFDHYLSSLKPSFLIALLSWSSFVSDMLLYITPSCYPGSYISCITVDPHLERQDCHCSHLDLVLGNLCVHICWCCSPYSCQRDWLQAQIWLALA